MARGGGELSVPTSSEPPVFAEDLPSGPLRETVENVIEMRRVFPVAEIRRHRRGLDLVDRESKTVVRCVVEERRVREPVNGSGAGPWSDAPGVLILRGVRGYDAEFALVERFLRLHLGLGVRSTTEFEDALEALARTPEPVRRPELHPEERADVALSAVLLSFLEDIERNAPGTRADLDTEFLHDLRVATRRTRAILSEFRGLFARAAVEHYGRELGWLGGITGPTRDLDVFLLKRDEHLALVSEDTRIALREFTEVLERRRTEEQHRLAVALGSERFRLLLRNWREFLETGADPESGVPPLGVVAAQRIGARLKKVLKRGKGVTKHSDPADLHELRIQCKKLRYLFEVFRGLYDPQTMSRAVSELKKLQNVLGDVNDLSVHAAFIEHTGVEESDALSPATLLAMGRLALSLENERTRVGAKFFSRFARFTQKEHVDAVRATLAGESA